MIAIDPVGGMHLSVGLGYRKKIGAFVFGKARSVALLPNGEGKAEGARRILLDIHNPYCILGCVTNHNAR